MASGFQRLISSIPENQIIDAGWIPVICINAPPYKFIKSVSPSGYDVYVDISRENPNVTSITCLDYVETHSAPPVLQSLVHASTTSLEGLIEATIFEKPGGFVIIQRVFGQPNPVVKHYISAKTPIIDGSYGNNGYMVVTLTNINHGRGLIDEQVELVVRRIRNILYPDCITKLKQFETHIVTLVDTWNKFNNLRGSLTDEPDPDGGPVLGSLNRDIETLAKIGNKLAAKGIHTDVDRMHYTRLTFTRYKRETDISTLIDICSQFGNMDKTLQGVIADMSECVGGLEAIKDGLHQLTAP